MDFAIQPKINTTSSVAIPPTPVINQQQLLELMKSEITPEQENNNIHTLAIQIIETTEISPKGHYYLKDVLIDNDLHPAETQRIIDTMKSERGFDKKIVEAFMNDQITDISMSPTFQPLTPPQVSTMQRIFNKISDPAVFVAALKIILTDTEFASQLT